VEDEDMQLLKLLPKIVLKIGTKVKKIIVRK